MPFSATSANLSTSPPIPAPAVGGRFSDDGAAGVFGGYRGSDPKPRRNELLQVFAER